MAKELFSLSSFSPFLLGERSGIAFCLLLIVCTQWSCAVRFLTACLKNIFQYFLYEDHALVKKLQKKDLSAQVGCAHRGTSLFHQKQTIQ